MQNLPQRRRYALEAQAMSSERKAFGIFLLYIAAVAIMIMVGSALR